MYIYIYIYICADGGQYSAHLFHAKVRMKNNLIMEYAKLLPRGGQLYNLYSGTEYLNIKTFLKSIECKVIDVVYIHDPFDELDNKGLVCFAVTNRCVDLPDDLFVTDDSSDWYLRMWEQTGDENYKMLYENYINH